MREAQFGSSSAACPANAKSATHSVSRGRMSGRHKNFPVSFQFSAEIPRLVSSTSRAPRYTSQQTSNASSGLTLISAPPLRALHAIRLRTPCEKPLNLSFRGRGLPEESAFYWVLQKADSSRKERAMAQRPSLRSE